MPPVHVSDIIRFTNYPPIHPHTRSKEARERKTISKKEAEKETQREPSKRKSEGKSREGRKRKKDKMDMLSNPELQKTTTCSRFNKVIGT